MKKDVQLLLCIAMLLVMASCASNGVIERPYETLTLGAIQHFEELREAGKLPGIGRTEHGQVETEAISQSNRVSYPVSVVLHVAAAQDRSRQSYTFTKKSSVSGWVITKAWRTMPDGQREDLKVE